MSMTIYEVYNSKKSAKRVAIFLNKSDAEALVQGPQNKGYDIRKAKIYESLDEWQFEKEHTCPKCRVQKVVHYEFNHTKVCLHCGLLIDANGKHHLPPEA